MEQLSSRVVYRNPWMSVREDDVRTADNGRSVFGVVDKPDFALVVPREGDGFWVVEQFRYPVGRRAVEFPQGSWGHGGEGSAIELARTELREEAGLSAGRLTHLGRVATAYGFCSQSMDVYLAEELEQGEPDREPTEQDMTHRWVSDDEFRDLVLTGAVCDSGTLAAWSLYRLSGFDR